MPEGAHGDRSRTDVLIIVLIVSYAPLATVGCNKRHVRSGFYEEVGEV
jgi:hypothetical protein